MELSIKALILLAAVMLVGLSAGLFYGWSVSVIPGTQRVADSVYLESMQNINRAILNPAFFLVFFGSAVLLFISSFTHYATNKTIFWLLLGSAVIYLAGMVGVTGMGNVPLNNQLDALNLSQLSPNEMADFRNSYEDRWNRLNHIRTAFAIVAFVISIVAVFIYSKN